MALAGVHGGDVLSVSVNGAWETTIQSQSVVAGFRAGRKLPSACPSGAPLCLVWQLSTFKLYHSHIVSNTQLAIQNVVLSNNTVEKASLDVLLCVSPLVTVVLAWV